MKMTKTEIATIDDFLAEQKKKIANAMPRACRPDRLIRIALAAMSKAPKLRQCTRESVLSCIMDLAQLGLEPDGRRAHLIPYGTVCTLIVDYKGLADLVRRSGEVSYIHTDVVDEKDEFSYSHGSNAHLTHKPAMEKSGKVVAAYSFVKLKDGGESFDVMTNDEIEAIHKRSKAGNSGPWVTDWKEMAKKTVFRRHTKMLPMSSESSELLQMAVEKDYDTPIDITPEPANGKPPVEMPKEKVLPPAEQETPAPADAPGDAQEGVVEPPETDSLICSGCKAEIQQNVYDFSVERYGTPLCFKCQKGKKGSR